MFKWPCIVIIFVQLTNNMHQVSKIFILSWNSTCFGHLLCPSSGVITCTSQVGTAFQPNSRIQRPHNLHETYQLPCVQLITPDDGHRRCAKHVVSWQNNFGYLMHLVGYVYEDTLTMIIMWLMFTRNSIWQCNNLSRNNNTRQNLLEILCNGESILCSSTY